MRTEKVVIIGAGLAAFALATELVDEGFNVEILEKQSYIGGRASDRVDRKMHDPVPIGPHVYVAWYNNFFRFLRKIHAHRLIKWERAVCLEIVYKDTHHKLRFYNLPAPFFTLPWILTYPFMTWKDKMSNRRLLAHVYVMSEERIERLDISTAYEYLISENVTIDCIDRFWRPIVFSLLNVPLETCSAAEFAMLVKRWSRLRRRKFGFPKIGLGDIYADEARDYIVKRGASIRRMSMVESVHTKYGRVTHLVVSSDGQRTHVTGDIFISTLNPVDLSRLLEGNPDFSELVAVTSHFKAVPYIAVNVWFDSKMTHKQFWALYGTDANGTPYMNTDFYDLSNIYEPHREHSYIASNIIYSAQYDSLSDREIIERTVHEIHKALPHARGEVVHAHVHRIPYVVYAPHPGLRSKKIVHEGAISNLYVTGDLTVKEIPQCMEAAVRSGYKCAERVLAAHGISKQICDDRFY